MSRLLVWLHWQFTAGQNRALGQDSGMADASEDDGGNGNSGGEDNDIDDNAEEGKLLSSACCAYSPQLCDPMYKDLTALALSQAPHQPMGNLAASLLVGHLQDNSQLVGTLLLVPVERS